MWTKALKDQYIEIIKKYDVSREVKYAILNDLEWFYKLGEKE